MSEIGKRYGRLTLREVPVSRIRSDGKRERRVQAICDCGSLVETAFYDLVSGKRKSCGCWRADRARESLQIMRLEESPPQIWLIDGDVASISIRETIVLVDAADVGVVSGVRWYLNGNGYASHGRTGNPQPYVLMHRLIRQAVDGTNDKHTDHVNGNRTDNRRVNLRRASRTENSRNKSKQAGTSSRYKGCSARRGRYNASIGVNRRRIWLGSFRTQEEAARAYDKAASRYFGAFAKLNFPRAAA